MKVKTNLWLLGLIGFLATLSACNSNAVTYNTEQDSKTGWYYSNEDWGGFEVVQYVEQEAGPDQVLIEGGVFTMGNTEQDVMFEWNSIRRRVTLSSYYMDQTEVTNLNYLMYLHWISRVFVEYPEILQNALPDTLVWRDRLEYNEPFVEYYFRHPAFQNYPVVGITWVQANEYCQWRTDRVNEKLLIDAGVLDIDPQQQGANNFNTEAYIAGQYEGATKDLLKDLEGNPRNARVEDGIMLPRFRLPTEAEWEYAALSLIGNSETERISNYRFYPWDGHGLRNPEKPNRGIFMANYVRGKGDYMGVAGYLNDNAAPTAPVDAYWPNDYGLYCMAGNVNEWVLDVYRPSSSVDMGDFNPYRGNVFTTLVRDSEGKLVDKNDTTGQMRYRNMGEISEFSDLTQEEVEGELDRYNYKVADNRNYRDGDLSSTIGPDWITDDGKSGSQRMYNYDGTNPDEHDLASSLVTDEVRVYKGGGWKDRAYWLVPGTRRFLDQNRATNDIGFRCAMIRVGSPGGFN
ncbi:MAG: SUMF1/EgtB/PvdO family nonheme iron enzyme [Bacteroidales bacterium]|nr:SUMF1/EgtB/PvdO family nonheme iron enzyme [Bacteroidales bacterium]